MIIVTDTAFQQLRTLVQEQDDQTKGLRLFVEKGGCAGMQYGMALDHPQTGDELIERGGLKVIVDSASRDYLDGCTLDYSDDLAGAGFRIKNPKAVRSCGCGTSFETAETPERAAEHTH
jgi:iron-sulfur cluster assembly protein